MKGKICPFLGRSCIELACPSYIHDRKPYPYEKWDNDGILISAIKVRLGIKPKSNKIWIARPSRCNLIDVDLMDDEEYWEKYEGYDHL